MPTKSHDSVHKDFVYLQANSNSQNGRTSIRFV